MIDRPQSEGFVKGKALDILESGLYLDLILRFRAVQIEDIQDSDIVVMTAGIPRNQE